MFVHRQGGVSNRPGTEFVVETKEQDRETRLIPFIFNDNNTYILEVGHLYIRIYSGTALKSEVVTPYVADEYINNGAATEIFDVNYVQSGDVITLVHPSHPPQELKRISDASWTISEVGFFPDTNRTSLVSSSSTGGSNEFTYTVTGISADSGEESLRGDSIDGHASISSITQADPAVVTLSGVFSEPIKDGDVVHFFLISGMTELNNKQFKIKVNSQTEFQLVDVDSTNFNAYTTSPFPGRVIQSYFRRTNFITPSVSTPITLSWLAIPGIKEYNIYKKQKDNTFGLIGITESTTFDDIGAIADTSIRPPSSLNPFLGEDNFPSTVTYIQQRLTFANTNNEPEKIFMSRTGDFKNFTVSNPSQADDSIIFNTAGRQVNRVKHLIDLSRLVILTDGAEWSLSAGDSGVVTPTTLNTRQSSYNGSGDLQPVIINGDAIYQQARGSVVRSLVYDFEADNYKGNDLTIFSNHLFDKFELRDWGYQQIFHSILWVVREDGGLLGLTYLKEQNILAWHRHDLGEGVESVAVIPEGNEDVPYFVVKRTINGVEKRYIESFTSRLVKDIEDMKFMDSSATFDGTNTTTTTLSLDGGTTWAFNEKIELNASAATFVSALAEEGNEYHLTIDGEDIRFSVTDFVNSTQVLGFPHRTVIASEQSNPVTTWGKAVDSVGGGAIDHLEGEAVSIFADGNVIASPNNPDYATITVTGGIVSFPQHAVKIHVGIPYISDIETLNIDSVDGETLSDKKINITQLTLAVEETRGVWAGNSAPKGDDATECLEELKVRDCEGYDASVGLATDNVEITLRGQWNNNGRVFVRQIDPVPVTILAIHPAGNIPF